MTITFSQAVGEFGLSLTRRFDNNAYTVSFTAYNAGTSLGTFSSNGYDGASGTSFLSFAGLRASSGSLITSLVVTNKARDNMMLGNFEFGTPAVSVPEPSSLALFATCAAGIMAVGRRRQSGSAYR